MNIDHFFFRLYNIEEGSKSKFLGSCFPVTSDGGLLTCRHVAEIAPGAGRLAIHDNISGEVSFIERVHFSKRSLDLAYIPHALPGDSRPFLPILTPSRLLVGEEVYSYGFFGGGGNPAEVEQGYFSGRVVNFTKTDELPPVWSLTLPYPLIEGMSGSPILTYHNGPKVVGLGYGNRSARILASEVLEFEEGGVTLRETVNRIVEFGLAYHCAELVGFLAEVGAGGHVVTEGGLSIPELE